MTLATLTYIGKPSDPWGDRQLIFIDLQFSDHDPGSLATNERGLASRIRELEDRRGKPSEYEFSDNGRGGFKVKLPKAEDVPRDSKAGGSKWQPRSLDERAEMFASVALKAWAEVVAAALPAAEWAEGETATGMVKHAMREFVSEARSILNVEERVTTPGHSPESPRAPSSTPVGSEGKQPSAGGEPLPSDAGTTPPHPYLGNRDIAEPCRVLGCELQEENPIHVKRGQQ